MMISTKTNDKYSICKLTKEIQKELAPTFDCGNTALSAFLNSQESLDDSFGKTYIMLSNNSIIGYYNISTGYIEISELPEPVRAGGAIYINCLAVDKKYQKMKFTAFSYISDLLLADCIKRILYIRENHVGFSFVSLSSTQEGRYLYERNGFYEFEEDMRIAKNPGELTCTPMYLPLDYE